ncbi:radical SAM protein, partial [Nanoarchaeota archaeon]
MKQIQPANNELSGHTLEDIANSAYTEPEAHQTSDPSLENYSICVFRIPENGGRALWEITNNCNYRCGYCIFSADNGQAEGELTTDEAFKVLDGLKERGFSHIKFTGGEPFKRKDFMDILARSCEMGFEVDVSTNASLITPTKAETLAQYGLNMVHVSVDGHDRETHELARGNKTYNPTMRGLQNLAKQDVYVRIGAVLFNGNDSYIEEMVESAAENGADEIIFSYMEPAGRMKDDYSMASKKSIPELKSELDDLTEKYSGQINVNYSFSETDDSANYSSEGRCPGGEKFVFIDNI